MYLLAGIVVSHIHVQALLLEFDFGTSSWDSWS